MLERQCWATLLPCLTAWLQCGQAKEYEEVTKDGNFDTMNDWLSPDSLSKHKAHAEQITELQVCLQITSCTELSFFDSGNCAADAFWPVTMVVRLAG